MTDSASSKYIQGRTGPWEIVLGLEVHAQVASNAKLFSGAAVGFGAGPNEQVSLVDAAMPGMLPVINRRCVEQAVRTGLGLKAQINLKSRFDRKNYFYPDLPQGYQISQFAHPIVGEGEVIVERDDGSTFTVRIERLHLEQDAGKSIHDLDPNATYVDLNRAGTALMEIVSRPDMRSSEEAAAYVKKLRTILVYLGTCDGDMEKGNRRADVNVSVCRPGDYEKFRETGSFSHLGTRCEIKNVNSYRYIQQAIEYEARRQIEILEDGGSIDQETRLFDPGKGETRSMRSKEEAHDYRYFPDPDLLPLEFDDAFITELSQQLPELPDEKQARFINEYGVTPYDAMVLTLDRETADYYEACVKHSGTKRDGKAVANILNADVAAFANSQGLAVWETHLQPRQIAGPVDLIAAGTISSKGGKDVLQILIAEEPEGEPSEIVERRGLKQVTDLGAIEKIVDEIIAANPDQVEKVKAKPTMIGWFVGQAMKASGGKANPQALNDLMKKKLGIE
jgi:aspartyl-tRNA(Asn)/glutamyl-tRNA(Gln) amidotransferase subunit B